MPEKMWLILEICLWWIGKLYSLNYLDQVNSILSQDFGVNICNPLCQTRLPLYHGSVSQFWQNAIIVFSAANKNHYKHIMFNEAFTDEK